MVTLTMSETGFHSCSLQIRSRAFGTERGPTLLPIIDMANHHSDCPHKLTGWPPELCGDGDPEGCIVLEAGAAVTAGQEICYAYTPGMLQDEAVLQYGFLQVGFALCFMLGAWYSTTVCWYWLMLTL